MTPDAARVLRLLAAGKTTQHVADATSWPRDRVKALGLKQKGWLHDPESDEMYDPNSPDGSVTLPPQVEQASRATGRAEEVLARAEASNDPKLRRLAASCRRLLGEITERLVNEQRAAAVAREIERLQRQLAETQAKHRELTGRKTPGTRPATPAAGGEAAKQRRAGIRAWAAAQGLDCPALGRIPKAVEAAYDEAHGGNS